MPEAHISVEAFGHVFPSAGGPGHEVLRNCSFEIRRGEFVSIVGPSGCGKTTLFNAIAGLVRPTSGEVLIGGDLVRGPSARVGYMLQKDLLMPWRTALENVTLGLEIRGVPRGEARERGLEHLRRYGLAGFEHHYPRALSGGMRQRVALVRTLVAQPEIVLLDEPFSALDYQTRLTLETDVVRIIREAGCTAVLITHDIDEAISVSDRVIVLGGKPARVKSTSEIALTTLLPRTPIASREAPEFSTFHRRIWDDLDVSLPA
jgi:NitT/TauT family transport system ATP-binding protein